MIVPVALPLVEFPVWVWLAALALSGAGLLAVVGLMIVRPRDINWPWRILQTVLIGLAVLAVSDSQYQAGWQIVPAHGPWPRLLVIAGIVGAIGLLVASDRWSVRHPRWGTAGRGAAYLAAYTLALASGYQRFYDSASPPEADAFELRAAVDSPRIPADVGDVYGLTDLGRPIGLQIFTALEGYESVEPQFPESYLGRVIVARSKAGEANCHGWVFTGGRYLVPGVHVDTILHDNGYRVVDDPQPGDVIIYRDFAGQPMHTGLVKAVGLDGFVMIESKWGPLDTFLHLPDDQCYSRNYAYYRSDRGSNLLQVIDVGGDPVVLTDPSGELPSADDPTRTARDIRRASPARTQTVPPRGPERS